MILIICNGQKTELLIQTVERQAATSLVHAAAARNIKTAAVKEFSEIK